MIKWTVFIHKNEHAPLCALAGPGYVRHIEHGAIRELHICMPCRKRAKFNWDWRLTLYHEWAHIVQASSLIAYSVEKNAAWNEAGHKSSLAEVYADAFAVARYLKRVGPERTALIINEFERVCRPLYAKPKSLE